MQPIHDYLHVPKFNFRPVKNKEATWVEPALTVDRGFIRNIDGNSDPHTSRQIFPDLARVADIVFVPIASPEDMIKSGIFGGLYFGSGQPDRAVNAYKIYQQLPKEWFEGIYMSPTKPSWRDNKFQTKAGLDAKWWHERRLIDEVDPLGWFNWYCMFWLGRRIPEVDKRQIVRWWSFSMRHTDMALASARTQPNNELTPRYRQSLWQWAVNPYPDAK